MTILSKKEMSEEDIKLQYITPAILAKWDKSRITMETRITDGKICLNGNFVHRDKKSAKFADYVLYWSSSFPIAIVEAKDNNHSVSFGLQQAIAYAQMMDVPFVYSSNGDAFYEHDMLTGMEREIALDDFPTPDELMERYKANANGGQGLSENELAVISQPYYSSQNTYEPRYYQRVAVNRTVDAIARGIARLLLVMATGTGKTYTAFQIVYRLLKSGMKRKILYLADRNILVDQSIQQDFSPLEKVIHKINVAKDNKTTITSHQVYFSLYQQLIGDDDKEHFSELFDKDFFDLIIVDECHRGSAKEDIDLVPALQDYYTRHMADGTFVSWLALDGEKIVGTSGMSFVEKPPYFGCPSGKMGLLSSMFTDPDYRRKGIAKELLSRVVEEARTYGCGTVQITASDMGVLLYTDFGFVKNGNFMQYKL